MKSKFTVRLCLSPQQSHDTITNSSNEDINHRRTSRECRESSLSLSKPLLQRLRAKHENCLVNGYLLDKHPYSALFVEKHCSDPTRAGPAHILFKTDTMIVYSTSSSCPCMLGLLCSSGSRSYTLSLLLPVTWIMLGLISTSLPPDRLVQ